MPIKPHTAIEILEIPLRVSHLCVPLVYITATVPRVVYHCCPPASSCSPDCSPDWLIRQIDICGAAAGLLAFQGGPSAELIVSRTHTHIYCLPSLTRVCLVLSLSSLTPTHTPYHLYMLI